MERIFDPLISCRKIHFLSRSTLHHFHTRSVFYHVELFRNLSKSIPTSSLTRAPFLAPMQHRHRTKKTNDVIKEAQHARARANAIASDPISKPRLEAILFLVIYCVSSRLIANSSVSDVIKRVREWTPHAQPMMIPKRGYAHGRACVNTSRGRIATEIRFMFVKKKTEYKRWPPCDQCISKENLHSISMIQIMCF